MTTAGPAPAVSGFVGFGRRLGEFFEGLASDNSKQYWQRHARVYERDVRGPMKALVAELAGEFGEARIFRPNRDQRFSRGASPYKTYCGAVVSSYYCQVSAEGLMVGEGVDQSSAALAERYRAAVHDDRAGGTLERLFADLLARGWNLDGNRLKTAPRGFTVDHPRIDLLRYRSVWATRRWPADEVFYSAGCVDRVRSAFRELRPFYRWLSAHVFLDQPHCRR